MPGQPMGPPSGSIRHTVKASAKRKGKGKDREIVKRRLTISTSRSIEFEENSDGSTSSSDGKHLADRAQLSPPEASLRNQRPHSIHHLRSSSRTNSSIEPNLSLSVGAPAKRQAGSTVGTAIVVDSDSGDSLKKNTGRPHTTSQRQAANVTKKSEEQEAHNSSTFLSQRRPAALNKEVIRSGRKSLTHLATSSIYMPMDAETIRHGFQQGGTMAKKRGSKENAVPFIWERILFFQLPVIPFKDLIRNPEQTIFITIRPGAHFNGSVTYNPNDSLGKGTFKTAIPASLQFEGAQTPTAGLGSGITATSLAVPVALKRPFISEPPVEGDQQMKLRKKAGPKAESRLAYADEQQAISKEAKLLVWGNALLEYAYSFIFDFIKNSGIQDPDLPPWIEDLPVFRFVQAGVAVALKDVEGNQQRSSHRAVYLLEEMLPGERSDFVKYINNAKAVPLIEPDEPDFELADFLTFIQHVQFQITHKQAYVSDFQGVSTTLTDPQIITSPALGPRLFGEGNLGKAFKSFPEEHTCNKYCAWFKLTKLE